MSIIGNALSAMIGGNPAPAPEPWVRPQDWPDIDALAEQIVGDQDCAYFTYDMRKTPGYGWVGMYGRTANSTKWKVERGHVENGSFVADSATEVNSNAYFRQDLDNTYGDVQLYRVTSTGHITQFGLATRSSTNAQNYQNNMQPCVQKAGTLPWCTTLNSGFGTGTNRSWGTMWLERDALVPGKLASVTNMSSCWQNCYNLREIDLSGWDTSGWAVTTIGGCWQNCYLLQELDLSGFDTSSWAVTQMHYCWGNCRSLQALKIGNLDTSGWAITIMNNCWMNCASLQELDLDRWDTSDWAVTTLQSCWDGCVSLVKLKIGGWDTSNWAVTTLQSCWSRCMALTELDLDEWDTSNWSITALSSTWGYCSRLKSIGISGWDTSGWAVTTIGSCWQNCNSLEELDLSGWDTSGWALTSIAYTWQNCYKLRSLDFRNWDVSNWNISNMGNCWSECQSLVSLKGTGSWTFAAAITTASNTYHPNLASLVDFDGLPLSVDQVYTSALRLTEASLVNIFNALPTITRAGTIKIAQANKLKMTAAELAIATDKGWSLP